MRGSVTKKDGRYFIVYTVGKRIAKSGHRAGQLVPKQKWEKVPEPNTKKNADKLLAMRISEINRGTYQEIRPEVFSAFAKRWLRDYVDDPNHLKASSAGHYHAIFRTSLLPFFGDFALTDITPDLVQQFISLRSREGKSAQTIRNHLTPLGTMLKHASQWGYLRSGSSPMQNVQLPRITRKEMAFLTAKQVRTLLAHVPEEWHSLLVTTALTGMRLGEVLAMRWTNLDVKAGCYQIKERLYQGEFDVPKTRSSIRRVDLTPRVLAALTRHRGRQSELKLSQGAAYQDQGLVFCTVDGSPILRSDGVRRVLHLSLKAAELPTVRLHDLRHSYAALMIDQGANVKYIQRQLGHRSITTTLDTYGHLMPDAGAEEMRKLDAAVFGTA
jgi:integrase